MKLLPFVVAALATVTSSSHALLVTFDLRDSGAIAEIESGVIVRSGITATLTPYVSGATGTLNQTASGFGINANVSPATDATDQIDGDDGAESVSISFNQSVLFTQVVLSSTTSSDSGLLSFGSILHPLNGPDDIFPIVPNLTVLPGESVFLSWVSGNGFSFDNFTIDTDVPQASVPESGTTLAFFGLAGFGLMLFRRFRT